MLEKIPLPANATMISVHVVDALLSSVLLSCTIAWFVSSGVETAYPSRAVHLDFMWSSYCCIFIFLCSVLYIIARPFVLFLLSIVLSVLLRFASSGYHFSIINLFLHSIENPDSHLMFISEPGDLIMNMKILNGLRDYVIWRRTQSW